MLKVKVGYGGSKEKCVSTAPASSPAGLSAEPSPISKYRGEVASLKTARNLLQSLYRSKEELQTELEKVIAEREKLLEDQASDWSENLSSLRNQRVTLEERSAYLDRRIGNQEEALQRQTFQTKDSLVRVYRDLAYWTYTKECSKIAELVHPDYRSMQKNQIETIAQIATDYIEVKKLEPTILADATNPLVDTPARSWSEIRATTMVYLLQSLEELVALSERLFEAIETAESKGFEIPPIVVALAPEKIEPNPGPSAAPVEESVPTSSAKANPLQGIAFGSNPSFGQ
jgi:ElaB/YqjD/DUF883 family membrane-anchored ribosome-binding protein